MRSWIARIGRGLRDGWLILGLAFLVLLGLEVAYRLTGTARAVARRVVGPSRTFERLPRLHPYADSAWYAQYLTERDRFTLRWEPFVYYRGTPVTQTHLNVDSAGLRVVPRYPVPGGTPLRVFFLGGSTTWGYDQRDAQTRPAVVARRLAAAGYDAHVQNFAQHGYTSGQELLAMVIELRRGNIPDVVVFWDGVNDVPALRQNGRPGLSVREFDRAEDASLNQRRRATGRVDMPLALRSLVHTSALLTRLLALTQRPALVPPVPEPVGFCRSLMRDWLGFARVVDGLAEAYGFDAFVVWQPQWETAGRPMSAWERSAEALDAFRYRPLDAGLGTLRLECARVADSLVAARASPSILNWSAMHRDDTATVFIDAYAHAVERATAIEGDSLAVLILAQLGRGHNEGGARRDPVD